MSNKHVCMNISRQNQQIINRFPQYMKDNCLYLIRIVFVLHLCAGESNETPLPPSQKHTASGPHLSKNFNPTKRTHASRTRLRGFSTAKNFLREIIIISIIFTIQ
jgi:hypothetical protein